MKFTEKYTLSPLGSISTTLTEKPLLQSSKTFKIKIINKLKLTLRKSEAAGQEAS